VSHHTIANEEGKLPSHPELCLGFKETKVTGRDRSYFDRGKMGEKGSCRGGGGKRGPLASARFGTTSLLRFGPTQGRSIQVLGHFFLKKEQSIRGEALKHSKHGHMADE